MADILTIECKKNNSSFNPVVLDGVTIEWSRSGTPGKLTFSVLKSGTDDFFEGDVVKFWHDETPMFYGFIFKKQRNKDGEIKVTAYDQLRYFKNKYTYVFTNKTGNHIVNMLANDFQLYKGSIDPTGYVIPSLIEENKTAFDIVGDVIDETLVNTGKMFVLYDDFGKLMFRDTDNMYTDLIIMNQTAENFDYTSSIDDNTYNKVVLYYKEEDGTLMPYYARDAENIDQWGLLQYFEETDVPSSAQNKAKKLLELYNRKTRSIKITNAFGDPKVRAGNFVILWLDLGDFIAKNYVMVESVKHTFSDNYHTMDLTVEGEWGD